MRTQGVIKNWNNDRGFGFIESPDHEREIFVHISAFPQDEVRPRVGERVSFELRRNSDGKWRAVAIQRLDAVAKIPRKKPTRVVHQQRSMPLISILLVLGIVAYVVYTRFSPRPNIIENFIPMLSSTPAAKQTNFRCDGRQYCSEMRSRAEAEFFIRNCPNTKMDGDRDGIPCENDSRF